MSPAPSPGCRRCGSWNILNDDALRFLPYLVRYSMLSSNLQKNLKHLNGFLNSPMSLVKRSMLSCFICRWLWNCTNRKNRHFLCTQPCLLGSSPWCLFRRSHRGFVLLRCSRIVLGCWHKHQLTSPVGCRCRMRLLWSCMCMKLFLFKSNTEDSLHLTLVYLSRSQEQQFKNQHYRLNLIWIEVLYQNSPIKNLFVMMIHK